jgi:uncharacterized membrane protein
MDRSGGITLAGVLVGLVAGFGAGILYSVMRRAWKDVGTAQGAVPKLKKSAWGRSGEALFLGFLLVVAVAYALGTRH